MGQVVLQRLTKQYDDVTAVCDVNLTIADGEFFSLLGPSGCGKTTLLRMVAGFIPPTEGRILFDHQDVTSTPPNQRNTAMVFQNYALFPHMTVFENVAFGLKARKIAKPEIASRVQQTLDLVGLSELSYRPVPQLSGGQQQRVALARAIVIEPDLLLLDEPLSNLDAKLRQETRGQIKALQRRLGITTIYVTHDQEEALALSDRMAVMREGVCQQVDRPEQIYQHPKNRFVAAFLGQMNLWQGDLVEVGQTRAVFRVAPDILLHTPRPDSNRQLNQPVWLGFPYQSVRLLRHPQGPGNWLPGRVLERQFRGMGIFYRIAVGAGEKIQLNMLQQNGNGTVDATVGDRIFVTIPEQQIHLLED